MAGAGRCSNSSTAAGFQPPPSLIYSSRFLPHGHKIAVLLWYPIYTEGKGERKKGIGHQPTREKHNFSPTSPANLYSCLIGKTGTYSGLDGDVATPNRIRILSLWKEWMLGRFLAGSTTVLKKSYISIPRREPHPDFSETGRVLQNPGKHQRHSLPKRDNFDLTSYLVKS